jgi:acetoin utilization protein AcuB
MRIESRMKHPVHTVKPHDSVAHARELLERHRVNQLPVVVDDRLVGIVTDRDLRDAFPSVLDTAAGRRPRAGARPEDVPVEDVMTRDVITLAPADRLAEAARVMRRQRIGAVPIVAHGRLVGLVTRSDVLDAFADSCDQVAMPEAPTASRARHART